MRILLLPLLFAMAFHAHAQVGYENFYSEKDLQTVLQHANTVAGQLDATGSLAVYYKQLYNDSLAAIYLKKVYSIAENSKDPQLMARALWWDNYYDGNIEKATRYLKYAEQHDLLKEEIAAHLSLNDIYIHTDVALAEQNAVSAKRELDSWRNDTLGKDSMMLQVNYAFAHTYIHKNDGVKTFQHFLVFQDYAEQTKNMSLRIQAIESLGGLYFEWDGQEKKAFPWLEKAYNYYNTTRQFNQLMGILSQLAILHSRLDDKQQAEKYFKKIDKLQDSLGVYSFFQYYWLLNKYGVHLLELV